jgi:hypothetical protein
MRIVLNVFCGMLSFATMAEEAYIPPTILTDAEVKKAEVDLEKSHANIRNHWNARLAMATENEKRMAKSITPLRKPYYGDSGHKH